MDKRSHAVSLLLLMVLMVVSVLGVLALVTARSDRILAERQADYATAMQSCTNQAMRWLSGLKADASEGTRTFSSSFSDGALHRLDVTVELEGETIRVVKWQSSSNWEDAVPAGNAADPQGEAK